MKANEFWIARDSDGMLKISNKKLSLWESNSFGADERDDYVMAWFNDGGKDNSLYINKKLFPEVTFENSPQKVRIEMVKE